MRSLLLISGRHIQEQGLEVMRETETHTVHLKNSYNVFTYIEYKI
jgi:hypothetical protein